MNTEKLEHINFAVGPVMMEDDILQIGARQIPYFRTEEFAALMKENEYILKRLFDASEDSKVLFLTTSGTGAMEAVVMNSFTTEDKVLIVNGGGFGERFVQICRIHQIPYEDIVLLQGQCLTEQHLDDYKGKGFTGFLVNMHETSTGVLYDMKMIGRFCKENNLFLVVDAISSFLADEIHMADWNINIIFTGSQKALALPPGLAVITLDEAAIIRIGRTMCKSLYMDFKLYLEDNMRGQTPFTPAVSILLQLNEKLRSLEKKGIQNEINRVRELADDFRGRIKDLPFEIASDSLSNSLTPLKPKGKMSAFEIFEYLDKHDKIWICPNGGDLKYTLFRVGHLGALTLSDNDRLIEAFTEMKEKGIL